VLAAHGDWEEAKRQLEAQLEPQGGHGSGQVRHRLAGWPSHSLETAGRLRPRQERLFKGRVCVASTPAPPPLPCRPLCPSLCPCH
jgi:hypothetical protein